MMATASRDILYGRLAGFQVDVVRLREHYQSVVSAQPATRYKDNEAEGRKGSGRQDSLFADESYVLRKTMSPDPFSPPGV